MKKSYEIPEIDFIEIGEKDCIVMSGNKNLVFDAGDDPKVDFGSLFGGN